MVPRSWLFPSSAFVMGHGHADNPEHTVTLSDYWIYATDVTNAQYALCVAQERCTAPDLADNLDYSVFESRNRPVVGVTYDQAPVLLQLHERQSPDRGPVGKGRPRPR